MFPKCDGSVTGWLIAVSGLGTRSGTCDVPGMWTNDVPCWFTEQPLRMFHTVNWAGFLCGSIQDFPDPE